MDTFLDLQLESGWTHITKPCLYWFKRTICMLYEKTHWGSFMPALLGSLWKYKGRVEVSLPCGNIVKKASEKVCCGCAGNQVVRARATPAVDLVWIQPEDLYCMSHPPSLSPFPSIQECPYASNATYTILPKVLAHMPWLTYEFKWHPILNP